MQSIDDIKAAIKAAADSGDFAKATKLSALGNSAVKVELQSTLPSHVSAMMGAIEALDIPERAIEMAREALAAAEKRELKALDGTDERPALIREMFPTKPTAFSVTPTSERIAFTDYVQAQRYYVAHYASPESKLIRVNAVDDKVTVVGPRGIAGKRDDFNVKVIGKNGKETTIGQQNSESAPLWWRTHRDEIARNGFTFYFE